MTTTTYIQHPIRDTLERLLALEKESYLFEPEVSSNEQYAHGRDKVFAFGKLIQAQLDSTPALYASVSGLSQMQGVLQAIFNELSAYLSNHNLGHLSNAAAQVDQAVPPLYWVLGWHQEASLSHAGAVAIDTLESGASEAIQRLATQRTVLEAAVAGLKAEIEQQQSRLSEMTTAVATQKADAASVVATVNKEYAEFETKQTTSFRAMIQSFEDRAETVIDDTNLKAIALLDALKKNQADAERIVQVVGNVGITGNFQKIANSEGLQANIWRIATLGFFAVGVELAILTFLKFYDEPFHPETIWSVVIRLLFAIAITAPAWYTAKESARHRTNSDRARQTELELASLGPFIELMPEDKKVSIREDLTKRYFGNRVEEHLAEPPVKMQDFKDIAIEAIKALKR